MRPLRLALIALVVPVFAFARAQNAPKPAPAPLTGFAAEFSSNLDEVESKIVELAEATPAEKYSWRPAPGVRSFSEVFMHIAGGNYFLSTFLGTTAPKIGDLEKSVTKKADVIVELKKSFEHLRGAAAHVDDLEKPVKLFGNTTTERGVLLTILNHLHEHLGQAIAYGRMNGVVPPWSR